MDMMNKQERLKIQIREDLIERSKQGFGIHPLGLTAVFLTTGLMRRAPGLAWLSIAAILSVVLGRVLVLRKIRNLEQHTPTPDLQLIGRYDQIHVTLLVGCSVVWGIAFGIVLFRFGYWDPDVLTFALYHCAIAFGAISIFVHSRPLMNLVQACFFGPSVLGHLLHGGPRPSTYAVILFLFTLFCVAKGKRLNELYLQQISDQFDLSVAAYQDCLTGLPNRLYMREVLESRVAEAAETGRQLALLYIDLDGFKRINDQHSHKIGDLFLCEAAARMRRCLRQNDVIARIGGDEFTVLTSGGVSEEEAVSLAQRLLLVAREPVFIEGKQLHYSASIGISLFPSAAASTDRLLRSADEAMYAAKTSGKTRICLALPSTVRHISIGNDLRLAGSA